MSISIIERTAGALWGMAVADALAMPSHWFYQREYLKQTFGVIKEYRPAVQSFPNSYLNKSNTGGPGGGGFQSNLVGDLILKGKKQFWARDKSYHYHHGMKAGDNTLDFHIVRVILRSLSQHKGFQKSAFLQQYFQFMTAKDSHNDVYASSAHRLFFKNFQDKMKLQECAGNDGHITDATDGILIAVPAFLFYLNSSNRGEMMKNAILSLRKSDILCQYSQNLQILMQDVVNGISVRQAAARQASKLKIKLEDGDDPMTACYISDNYASLLHFLHKYPNSTSAMLANANAGGQNVGRGALIGCIFGLSQGLSHLGQWTTGLVWHDQIKEQIDRFVKSMQAF